MTTAAVGARRNPFGTVTLGMPLRRLGPDVTARVLPGGEVELR